VNRQRPPLIVTFSSDSATLFTNGLAVQYHWFVSESDTFRSGVVSVVLVFADGCGSPSVGLLVSSTNEFVLVGLEVFPALSWNRMYTVLFSSALLHPSPVFMLKVSWLVAYVIYVEKEELSHEKPIAFASVALIVSGGVVSFVYPVSPVKLVTFMSGFVGAVLSIANELSVALKSVKLLSFISISMK